LRQHAHEGDPFAASQVFTLLVFGGALVVALAEVFWQVGGDVVAPVLVVGAAQGGAGVPVPGDGSEGLVDLSIWLSLC
jgi:hypothetical protein